MDRRGAALLERLVDDESFMPHGRVTVELRNERGKIVDRETKDNFVSIAWQAHAKALLRTRWMQYGYNQQFSGQTTAGTADGTWPGRYFTVPQWPAGIIGCWNQTDAEDSTNEHSAKVPATGLIAWATRWPFATPTGSRGNVNTTDSLINDTTVRHVFDWVTTAGNGTFQSVGWLTAGAPGVQGASFGTRLHVRIGASFTASSWIASGTSLMTGGIYVDPATGTAYCAVRAGNNGGGMRIVSMPWATPLDKGTTSALIHGGNPTAAVTFTSVSSEFTPTSYLSTSNLSLGAIGRNGSATVFHYTVTAGTNTRWGFVNDGTGTNTTYAGFHASDTRGGAVISGNAYLGYALSSSIFVAPVSTGVLGSTLTIDANVTAACTLASIVTPRVAAITTDGTDLIVIYDGLGSSGRGLMVRLNTSGVCQQIYGVVPRYQGQITETSGAPYAGTAVYQGGMNIWQPLDDYGPNTGDASGSTYTTEDRMAYCNTSTTGDFAFLFGGGGNSPASFTRMAPQLFYYDGAAHLYGVSANDASPLGTQTATAQWNVLRHGYDMGTRVLLGASKTKNSSQTMKITYDMTLPNWF